MTDPFEFAVRRILVGLDASAHSLAALEGAVELASRLKAELIGLFVEDINLLAAAGLPFTREVRFPSASEEHLDLSSLERELRVHAERARRALAESASRAQLRWSFRVARGRVAAEVVAAAYEVDLVSVGKTGQRPARGTLLGSTAMAAATASGRSVLLAQRGSHLRRPIVVVYDGSSGGQKALAAGVRLAGREVGDVVVLVLGGDAEHAGRLDKEVTATLRGLGCEAQVSSLAGGDFLEVMRAARASGSGLVVISADSPLLAGNSARQLLGEIDCCILLVR